MAALLERRAGPARPGPGVAAHQPRPPGGRRSPAPTSTGDGELVDALGPRPPGRLPRQPDRRLDRRPTRRRAPRGTEQPGPDRLVQLADVFTISVLGPVEVRRDGELVPVPAGKTSELLVRLALDAGRARCAPTGWSTTCGAPTPSAPAATRCSRRSPSCAARSAIRRSSSAATAATRSPSTRHDVDALAVLGRRRPRPRPARGRRRPAAPPSCARRRWRMFRGDCCPAPATASGSRLTGPGSRRPGCSCVETGFAAPAAARRGRRRDRRAGGGRRRLPVPGGPVGAADHGAVPRPGGRPTRWPRYQRVRRRLADELGPRPRAAAAAARAADPGPRRRRSAPTPSVAGRSTPAPATGNLPSMAAELVGRDAEMAAAGRAARRRSGWSRSSGLAASARRRSPSRPARDAVARPAACGWPGWRRRPRPTTSSTP